MLVQESEYQAAPWKSNDGEEEMKLSYLFCPICKKEVIMDTYIRDDKRRFRVHCENTDCECFPMKSREYDTYLAAETAWKKACSCIY